MLSFLERAALGLVLTGGLALAIFTLVIRDKAPAASATPKAQVAPKQPRAAGAPPTNRTHVPSPGTQQAKRRSASTTVVVMAARGSSWLELRAGSATGRSLYQGTLPDGQRAEFTAKSIWLRAGAAAHLDITVNGKPLGRSLFGTVETVLPTAGA